METESEFRERLEKWEPGSEGYSKNETYLAVGFRVKGQKVTPKDLLNWLGEPANVNGTSKAGYFYYYFENDDTTAGMYEIQEYKVTQFSSITRKSPNATRTDEVTGEKSHFNV